MTYRTMFEWTEFICIGELVKTSGWTNALDKSIKFLPGFTLNKLIIYITYSLSLTCCFF